MFAQPLRWRVVAVCVASCLAAPGHAQAGDSLADFLAERGLAPGMNPSASWRERSAAMVVDAMSFLDVRYRAGGNRAEEGFDCSGFTRHLFASNLGIRLPRRSHEQAAAAGLVAVRREELMPGDLVFFNTMRHMFSHVGIYVGDGRFIHAPRAGAAVRIEDMKVSYWARRFDGARRIAAASDAAAQAAAHPQSLPASPIVASQADPAPGAGH
jgi:hypothetical protein